MNVKEAYNQLTPNNTTIWNWLLITNKFNNELEFGGCVNDKNYEFAIRYDHIIIGIEHDEQISSDDFYQYIEVPNGRTQTNLCKSLYDFFEYIENTDFSKIKIELTPIYKTIFSHYEIRIS